MGLREIEKVLAEKAFCGVLLFYSPAEIAKMTKSSISNVVRDIGKLVELGVLYENSVIPFKKTYRLDRNYYNKHYCHNEAGRVESVSKLEDKKGSQYT